MSPPAISSSENRPGPRRPRGSRPDAETSEKLYLFKNVATLRATYQVRLLAFMAEERGKKLVLKVPSSCRFDAGLADLVRARPQIIEREELA
jgi:hypothetical protein